MIPLLPAHGPDDLVAVGPPSDRTATDLLRDVATVVRVLPPPEPAGEILVICADRYHFAVAALAVWQAGHAVALPPSGQPEAVRAVEARAEVLALLHDTDATSGLDLRTVLADAPAVAAALRPIAAERHVATLHTSGSTGAPKACAKTAAQLLGEAALHARTSGLGPGDRVLATVPSHHIYGLLWSVLVPLAAGGAFVRETPFHAEEVAGRLAESGARTLVSVPAHLRALEALEALPPLDRIVSSGAPLPASTAQLIAGRFARRVTEVYGSSETGGIALRDDPSAPWTPLPGIRCSADAEGRLLLDSPFLPPDAPRPWAGDDRIAPEPDGRFRLHGRLDGVLKVGSKRISLAEIERRLLELEGVRDAAVLDVPVGGARGVELRAAVVAPGRSARELKEGLRRWLDPVTVPRRVVVVEALPREANGKLPRERLRALLDPPPRTELLPHAESRWVEDGTELHDLLFRIPADLLYFRGHFEGRPVLPGVAQLEALVLRQARRLWPGLGGLRRILRLKFMRLIPPEAQVRLRLERREDAPRVAFTVHLHEEVAASGTLVFAPPPAAPSPASP